MEVDRILRLDPKDRTMRNIKTLGHFFEGNRFFKQQKQLFEEKTIQYLLRNLRFSEYRSGEKVFDYGDEGELFYIIMEGEVIIKTPAQDYLEGEQASPEGLLIFLIEYFNVVQWTALKDGTRIRNMLL